MLEYVFSLMRRRLLTRTMVTMGANKCKIHDDYPKVQKVQDKKGKRSRDLENSYIHFI
jgi:hypothetical protein